MATLVSDIIQQAFIDLGVIQPGETITADMLANAFSVLNFMIGNWSAERAVDYLVVHQNFTLSAGTAIYTLGTAGSLTTAARPVRVTSWNSASGQFSTGGSIIGFDEFRQKTLNATARRSVLPELVAADQLYPSITIEVFPTPDTAPGTLRLDYWTAFVAFTTTGQTVVYPDEYFEALHFNLAVALSPQYAMAKGISQELAANAQRSKGVIVAKNADILGLAPPQAAA